MSITPDDIIYWQHGLVKLNATIVFTWIVMALLAGASWLVTRRLAETPAPGRWQNMLEAIIELLLGQIREISQQRTPQRYLPFIGTLFLFIVVANILDIVPGFEPPTGSLSTTVALALCVLVAVPLYGITQDGLGAYLKHYIQPTPLLLPFHVISEFSRALALAVRLFGNIMSGSILVAILLSITPLFFPIVMEVLGLITGVIQAYIFSVLAMVYIAAAAHAHDERVT